MALVKLVIVVMPAILACPATTKFSEIPAPPSTCRDPALVEVVPIFETILSVPPTYRS